MFRVFNFRWKRLPTKNFYNENFVIYSILYLVVVSQYPAESTGVLLRQAAGELIIIAGNSKLVVVVSLLPSLLPQTDIVLWLTVTV